MAVTDVDDCECVAGYVLQGSICVSCPEHELEQAGACVCEDGFERSAEGLPCAEVSATGLGANCSETQRCEVNGFEYCALAGNGDRYCTSLCSPGVECEEGYACSSGPDGSFCRRYPLGLEAPCSTDADCAGTEATLCDDVLSHSCLVQGCSLSQNDCFEGWDCCDLSTYGVTAPLCVPTGDCPT